MKIKILSDYDAQVHNYKIWAGVRIKGIRILFLKRVIHEFGLYIYNRLIVAINPLLKLNPKIVEFLASLRSIMKLELVILDSVAEAP